MNTICLYRLGNTCYKKHIPLIPQLYKAITFLLFNSAVPYTTHIGQGSRFAHGRMRVVVHSRAVIGDRIVIGQNTTIGQSHGHDFLTVGSMGHSSSIALGIAMQKPDKKIWIIDGDGAALMHMGSMALMGAYAPQNVVHIVVNNGAHETVGGMPTVAEKIELVKIAEGCLYPSAIRVDNFVELDDALKKAKYNKQLSFIEVKCAIGARNNLGRPTKTAKENKVKFMEELK